MQYLRNKKSPSFLTGVKIVGSGGWNRTNGLQVMSLTSYHCSTPQCVFCFEHAINIASFGGLSSEEMKKMLFFSWQTAFFMEFYADIRTCIFVSACYA